MAEEDIVVERPICFHCGHVVILTVGERLLRDRLGLRMDLCAECARLDELKGTD